MTGPTFAVTAGEMFASHGNPKFWHVENGAIVGKSSAANPSGNSYILCRDIEAHDFTLKIEIRIDGTAGTGIQCRSKTN